MLRLTIASFVALSVFLISVDCVVARRPPIPIEVTGVIERFDWSNQTFTIQADRPAKILTIGVGHDCKFKQNGTEIGERILRRGACVKVNYFATIFTGNVAVEVDLIGRER